MKISAIGINTEIKLFFFSYVLALTSTFFEKKHRNFEEQMLFSAKIVQGSSTSHPQNLKAVQFSTQGLNVKNLKHLIFVTCNICERIKWS